MTDATPRERPGAFPVTQWSLVARAGLGTDDERQQALDSLCRTYLKPVYRFIRARSRDEHQAQESCQAFFVCLLQRDLALRADPEKGRFRNYLLKALQHFLINRAEYERTAKRGSGLVMNFSDLPVEEMDAVVLQHADYPPDTLYDIEWAVRILERSFDRLEQQYERKGKQLLFTILRQLSDPEQPPTAMAEAAQTLGMTVGALKISSHRFRRQLRETMLNEVGQTVADPQEARQELNYLHEVLTKHYRPDS